MALWDPSHRSRVNSGQRFNRASIGEPLLNTDGKLPGGLRVVHLGRRVVQY